VVVDLAALIEEMAALEAHGIEGVGRTGS